MKHDRWTSAEEEILRKMWEEGKTGKEIAATLGRGVSAVLFRKQRFVLKRRDTVHPSTNIDFFKTWSEKSAYVYGFVVTDGCVHDHLRLVGGKHYSDHKVTISQSGEAGRELLKRIQEETGGAIYGPYPREKGADQFKLTLLGKELVEVMKSHGVVPRKTFVAEVPDGISEHNQPHFFRGVVDGDGSLSLGGAHGEGRSGLVLTVTSASKRFVEQLRAMVRSQTDVAGTIVISKGKYFILSYSWGSAMKVAAWMYEGKEESLWLPRKFKVFEQQRKQLGSI